MSKIVSALNMQESIAQKIASRKNDLQAQDDRLQNEIDGEGRGTLKYYDCERLFY